MNYVGAHHLSAVHLWFRTETTVCGVFNGNLSVSVCVLCVLDEEREKIQNVINLAGRATGKECTLDNILCAHVYRGGGGSHRDNNIKTKRSVISFPGRSTESMIHAFACFVQ